tara:strand:- start:110 stop:211 length:102 start_codon:yes stop_codon:yes gene_type:complete
MLSRIIERYGDKYLLLFLMLEEAMVEAKTRGGA